MDMTITGGFFDVGSAFNPFTRAPDAPHVVWTRPIDDGGIVGGAGAIDQSTMFCRLLSRAIL